MRCPKCEQETAGEPCVWDTRHTSATSILRRRDCPLCGHRWVTTERICPKSLEQAERSHGEIEMASTG